MLFWWNIYYIPTPSFLVKFYLAPFPVWLFRHRVYIFPGTPVSYRGAVRVVCEQGVPNIWSTFLIRILICFACVCRRTSRAVNCVFLMTALSHHTAGLADCFWLTVQTVDNGDNAGKLISPRPLSAALMLTLTGRDATFHDVSWWSKFHQKFHQKFQRTFR